MGYRQWLATVAVQRSARAYSATWASECLAFVVAMRRDATRRDAMRATVSDSGTQQSWVTPRLCLQKRAKIETRIGWLADQEKKFETIKSEHAASIKGMHQRLVQLRGAAAPG